MSFADELRKIQPAKVLTDEDIYQKILKETYDDLKHRIRHGNPYRPERVGVVAGDIYGFQSH